MYTRNYANSDSIPPNYKGNAFEQRNGCECAEKRNETCEKMSCDCEKKPDTGACEENFPDHRQNFPDALCGECENFRRKGEHEGILQSLFSRKNRSFPETDDLIIGGLIILLLNSHADDELLFILALLFLMG